MLLDFIRPKRAPGPPASGAAATTPSNGQTVGQRRRMALRPPSFTDMLPYVAYQGEDKVFVLKDGATLGAMFELSAIPTEAQAAEFLAEHALKVQEALQALPESDASPWIVQFFANDDRNLGPLAGALSDYIAEQHKDYPERCRAILDSRFTQSVLAEMSRHLDLVSRPQGLFTDTLVTGQVWRGQVRRVRCCIYKRFAGLADDPAPPTAQIESVAITLMSTFSEAGVAARRCTGRDLYEWLLPFFNRAVPWASTPTDLLRQAPYPTDEGTGWPQAPLFGCDLSDLLNLSPPKSDLAAGTFEFDGLPVKALALQSMRSQPQIGHFSAELQSGKESFARLDRLPAGAMLSISLTVQPQHQLERHIERIRDASRAKSAAAMETHRECEQVLARMVQGDKLYPMMMTLYVSGHDTADLEQQISQVNALLVPSGLRFIDSKHDLVPLDTFMRGLPFNFDPAFDNRSLRRSRLTFASHAAALLPVYGRARGTPHPGMWFWNRGGEPLWVDPLNRRDRKKNAHMLVLGPTGAGKSATLNYLAMMTMAIHKPRLVIVDAGRSFELLLAYFKGMGLSTHHVTLTSEADVSLPPFVHALRLLDDPDVMSSYNAAEQQARVNAGVPDDEGIDILIGELDEEPSGTQAATATPGQDQDDEGTERRDLLGEMLIAAIMMVTGGEKQEVARMGRADRYLVSRAIIRASVRCRKEGRTHPLTQDVAIELMGMHRDETLSGPRQMRAEEMGQSMMTFTQALRGKLFNREGQDWPDADVTLIEMGTLTQDGYGDALAVAYTSLIDSVQSRGERTQAEGRPIVFLTDEGHLITTNELLGPKIAKGTKMWRKLNIWFWLATQNLQDFPDSMERVLSMCEYWMLLTMDRSEIAEVARFRSLTPEQRHLMESARKEPPKYTEGVIISALGQMLFRNVPPALPIALAMTEGHEKAHRRRLMDQHGCTELEAAMLVAEELVKARG
ncbi:conjugative transfer ATPase [Acidovorax sp. SUPP2539]|uniref:conjugative transfer ATPase n=1 Tax=Acidovorax sp. SUPP2539 TaxID=2920878 RepID=UPI0023DE4FBB|nr:conjugative transfer ATPase [Acidovorax sp. SUPP2539]GKS92638.1 conjugative transfer ATPase [Acidovorax sp. SUPP2539]